MVNEIKTVALKDKDLNGLARQIENFQNKSGLISKGSLPFFNTILNLYEVIMFFNKPIEIKEYNNPQELVKDIKDNKITPGEPVILDERKEFKPSKEMLDRWRHLKPTTKTINLLRNLKFPEDELKNIKTQLQAHEILENLKEENI